MSRPPDLELGHSPGVGERNRNEDASSTGDERWRAIVDLSPDAIFVHAGAGILFSNPAMVAMMGAASADELLGIDALEILHPDSRDSIRDSRVAMAESGEPLAFQDLRFCSLDGREIWVEAAGAILPWNGESAYMVVARDVAARKEAEIAHRDGERRLRQITDAVPAAIVYVDRDHRVRFANKGMSAFSGIPQEVLIGKHLKGVRGEAAYREELPYMEAALSGDKVGYEGEWPAKDGRPVHFHAQYVPDVGEEGEVLGYHALISDITERVHAEQALRESEARYRGIVEDQTEFIGRALPDGTLTFVNDAFCRYFGKTREELIGAKFSPLIPDEDQGTVAKAMAGLTPGKPTVTVEHRAFGPDGQIRWHRWTNRLICDGDGHVVEMQSVGKDITVEKKAEIALRSSEEKFAKAFNVSPDSIIITRVADSVVVDANDEYLSSVGLPREMVVGRPVTESVEWVVPEDRQRYRAIVAEKGECREFPADFRTGNGEIVNTLISARTMEIDGEACILNITRKITDRIQTEAALRTSETRFRDFEGSASDWLWETGADHGITWVSQSYWEHTDHTEDQVLGCRPWEISGLQWEISGLQKVEPEKPTLLQQKMEAHESFHRFRYSRVDRSGQILYRSISGWPVFGDDGAFQGYRGTISDVTAEVEVERGYRRLVESSPTSLLVQDGKTIMFANNAAVTLYRAKSRDDLVGTPVIELIHPDERERYLERLARIARDRKPLEVVQQRRIALDGAEVVVETRGMPIIWQGKPAIMGAQNDITEQKQTADQLRQAQKMEAMGQLTGGVAHDFNNLLAVIMGNLQLIERRIKGEADLEKLAHTALTATRRGAALTRQLLSYARQQPLQPEAIDLNNFIDDMHDLLSRSLGEKHKGQLIKGRPLWTTLADPPQVQTALLNLIINASQAMPDGGTVTIETGNADFTGGDSPVADLPLGDYVALSVSDTGTGMSPQVIGRAFDPFFTTKEVGQGSGLGLSMVYGFAKQSGGGVKIDSTEGEGSTITLYLPRMDDHMGAGAGAADAEAAEQASEVSRLGGDETVLVVEDNAEVREVAIQILSNLGYRILEAEDGPEAIRVAEDEPAIDALFTDMVLPRGMTGADIAAELRRDRADLKILITSGNTQFDGGIDAGPVIDFDFLRKPYLADDLALKIRTLLDGEGGDSATAAPRR